MSVLIITHCICVLGRQKKRLVTEVPLDKFGRTNEMTREDWCQSHKDLRYSYFSLTVTTHPCHDDSGKCCHKTLLLSTVWQHWSDYRLHGHRQICFFKLINVTKNVLYEVATYKLAIFHDFHFLFYKTQSMRALYYKNNVKIATF